MSSGPEAPPLPSSSLRRATGADGQGGQRTAEGPATLQSSRLLGKERKEKKKTTGVRRVVGEESFWRSLLSSLEVETRERNAKERREKEGETKRERKEKNRPSRVYIHTDQKTGQNSVRRDLSVVPVDPCTQTEEREKGKKRVEERKGKVDSNDKTEKIAAHYYY